MNILTLILGRGFRDPALRKGFRYMCAWTPPFFSNLDILSEAMKMQEQAVDVRIFYLNEVHQTRAIMGFEVRNLVSNDRFSGKKEREGS